MSRIHVPVSEKGQNPLQIYRKSVQHPRCSLPKRSIQKAVTKALDFPFNNVKREFVVLFFPWESVFFFVSSPCTPGLLTF